MNDLHPLARPLRCLLLLCLLLPAAALADGPQRRVVAFGDSLVDSGNVFFLTGEFVQRPFAPIPDGPYLIGGPQFSNGPTWVQQLAGKLRARPTAGPSVLVPRLFSNYAFGGARARDFGESPSLTVQVGTFLHYFHGRAPASALYALAIGGNDLRDAIEATDDMSRFEIVNGLLIALKLNIESLIDHGARHFVIANLPNLAAVPALAGLDDEQREQVFVLAMGVNMQFEAVLAQIAYEKGVDIDIVDGFGLSTDIAHPERARELGFDAGATPCLTFEVRRRAICRDRDEHFYWDAIHPTRAGHALIAELAFEAIRE